MQKRDDILICNAGSSSLKLARWNQESGCINSDTYEGSCKQLEEVLQHYFQDNLPCGSILHRVVHGGDATEGPHEITQSLTERIEHWQAVSPQHNSIALALIKLARSTWSTSRNYALFDSALYSSLPEQSRNYAIPNNLSTQWPIKRYGFHGLAHRAQWSALNQTKSYSRIITLQLGSGCSATAWRDGEAVDTTMGFSPLEGLTMATRCGNIDASVVLHLLEFETGYTPSSLRRLLTEESGLKGLSGVSGDMRKLLASKEESAALAVDQFCYQIQKTIGSYMAVLGGVDAITFGGGIGENHAVVREKILSPLKNLSIVLCHSKNDQASGAASFHDNSSHTELWLIPVDEMKQMAQQFFASNNFKEKT